MEAGTLIGDRYRLLRRLGEGAMGVVWAATNVFTDRTVALKLIPRGSIGSVELRTRMLREARACGRIQHRNVVEIYDVGQTEGGDPFLVMQLLRGETLDSRLHRSPALLEDEAINIALSIARALAAAHQAGVVHRDLKPANVFLHRNPSATGVLSGPFLTRTMRARRTSWQGERLGAMRDEVRNDGVRTTRARVRRPIRFTFGVGSSACVHRRGGRGASRRGFGEVQ